MEIVFMFFVVVAAVAVASVMFCLWAAAAAVRGVMRAFVPAAKPSSAGDQACDNTDCRCRNPTYARFCRRCGRSLPGLLRAVASRAAIL